LPADSGIQGILLTAIVGAFVAYANQLWKYSKDAYHARVDEACTLIFALADRGAQYWSVAKREPKQIRQPVEHVDQEDKLTLCEILIEGQLMELQFLRLILEQRFSLSDRSILLERTASFQDAMTGGNFASKVRAPDTQRARQIYVTAGDLVAHVRNAANRGNRPWRIALRHIESVLPYRRPVTRAGRIEEAVWLTLSLGCFAVGCSLLVLLLWSKLLDLVGNGL
jgi:hypothetical protein